jgi:hypothetical protein
MLNIFDKPMTAPIWKSDSKKVRLRKYVFATRQYLKYNDIENANKYLTAIEELYNANN